MDQRISPLFEQSSAPLRRAGLALPAKADQQTLARKADSFEQVMQRKEAPPARLGQKPMTGQADDPVKDEETVEKMDEEETCDVDACPVLPEPSLIQGKSVPREASPISSTGRHSLSSNVGSETTLQTANSGSAPQQTEDDPAPLLAKGTVPEAGVGGVAPETVSPKLIPQLDALNLGEIKIDHGHVVTFDAARNMPRPRAILGQITDALSQAKPGETQITLTPEELGSVRFKVSQVNGTLNIVIWADRTETLDLMRRHLGVMMADLKEQGMTQANIDFDQGSGGGGRGFHAQGEPEADRPDRIIALQPDPKPASWPDDRLDVRL